MNDIKLKRFLIGLTMMCIAMTSVFANTSTIEARASNLKYLGRYRVSYYCPSCNGGYGTASGHRARVGRTIAVDRRKIKLGTRVRVGRHWYVAEDVGGAIKGKRIDIFCSGNCNRRGVRYMKVWVKK